MVCILEPEIKKKQVISHYLVSKFFDYCFNYQYWLLCVGSNNLSKPSVWHWTLRYFLVNQTIDLAYLMGNKSQFPLPSVFAVLFCWNQVVGYLQNDCLGLAIRLLRYSPTCSLSFLRIIFFLSSLLRLIGVLRPLCRLIRTSNNTVGMHQPLKSRIRAWIQPSAPLNSLIWLR